MSTIIDTTEIIAVPIHYKTDKSTDCQAQLQKYQHNGIYIFKGYLQRFKCHIFGWDSILNSNNNRISDNQSSAFQKSLDKPLHFLF